MSGDKQQRSNGVLLKRYSWGRAIEALGLCSGVTVGEVLGDGHYTGTVTRIEKLPGCVVIDIGGAGTGEPLKQLMFDAAGWGVLE